MSLGGFCGGCWDMMEFERTNKLLEDIEYHTLNSKKPKFQLHFSELEYVCFWTEVMYNFIQWISVQFTGINFAKKNLLSSSVSENDHPHRPTTDQLVLLLLVLISDSCLLLRCLVDWPFVWMGKSKRIFAFSCDFLMKLSPSYGKI